MIANGVVCSAPGGIFTMNTSALLENTRYQLINQLVYFGDELYHFLDQYCPEHNQKRLSVEKTLNVYTRVLEEILRDLTVEKLNSVALIGSKVDLRYLELNDTDSYVLVSPDSADPDQNKISFLSPMGFHLLLARRNETYDIEIPSGIVPVRVEDIRYHCFD